MPPLLSAQTISKSWSGRPLFSEISVTLEERERVGLIGPNGSGKSTLLKILAGLESADTGNLATRRGLRIVYVAQEDVFASGHTVNETLHQALAGSGLDPIERETQVQIMRNRVEFADGEQIVDTLSGGWRKRLALACSLLKEPDVLLLDEPTNHLDMEGIFWLEKLLLNAEFSVLVISHDRYFLENVATRLIELSRAYPDGYLSVDGSYSDFLDRKQEVLHAQAQLQSTLNTRVKREIEWLQRGAQARSTKAKYRVEEAGRLIETLGEVTFRNNQNRTILSEFSATQRKADELLVLKGVSKQLGGKLLFQNLDLTLSHRVRLGILGANGSGKSTLLRILSGELEPDSGVVRPAKQLKIVRFDQNRNLLNKETTLREALSPDSDYVQYRGNSYHVAGWAERYLFRREQLEMPVRSLSGGEQARVLLACLMAEPADILILDEPTNDLDIPTLEVLEESLLDFPGTVILVTHDRYLLDRVSTVLLALEGEGQTQFYAEFAQWEALQSTKSLPAKPDKSTSAPKTPPTPRSRQRLSTAEQRELANMEQTIMEAEEKVEKLQAQLQNPEIITDHLKSEALWKTIQQEQEKTAQLYLRWEELEARR